MSPKLNTLLMPKKKKFKCTLDLLPKTLCNLFHYTHSAVFSSGGFTKSRYPPELRLQTALKEWEGRQGMQSHPKPHCLAWHTEGFLCSNSSPFLSVLFSLQDVVTGEKMTIHESLTNPITFKCQLFSSHVP